MHIISGITPKIHYTRFPVTFPYTGKTCKLVADWLRTCRLCCRLVVDLLQGNWCNGLWPSLISETATVAAMVAATFDVRVFIVLGLSDRSTTRSRHAWPTLWLVALMPASRHLGYYPALEPDQQVTHRVSTCTGSLGPGSPLDEPLPLQTRNSAVTVVADRTACDVRYTGKLWNRFR